MKNTNLENLFYQYSLALEFLKIKFTSLNSNYLTLENNPIEHIKYRIKSYRSIQEKLLKKGITTSNKNIEDILTDVVGIRIVCSFFSDVKTIVDKIKTDPELHIIKEKDYITKPKKSGYSSYHLIVEIPLFVHQKTTTIKAEIQIRTIAMDMWASLEHKIWYKKNIKLPEKTEEDLKEIAQTCRIIDYELDKIIKTSPSLTKTLMNSINQAAIDIDNKELELLMLKYQIALQLVQKKITDLYTEDEENSFCNPIEHIKGRIKEPIRIFQKLQRQNQNLTIHNIEQYINDVAGLRIVCSFRSDLQELIQRMKDMIEIDPEITLIKEKDYVTNPKENGYAGYHMIIQVPIYVTTKISYVKVEIQLKTIAMDMWACLEHKLCYQKETEPALQNTLKNMAKSIYTIDYQMNEFVKETRTSLMNTNKTTKKKIKNLQK